MHGTFNPGYIIDNEWMNEMNYKYEWLDELINHMYTIALW